MEKSNLNYINGPGSLLKQMPHYGLGIEKWWFSKNQNKQKYVYSRHEIRIIKCHSRILSSLCTQSFCTYVYRNPHSFWSPSFLFMPIHHGISIINITKRMYIHITYNRTQNNYKNMYKKRRIIEKPCGFN